MKNIGNTPFSKFIWFMGVIEDVNDPQKLGRVRVRAVGFHSDDRTNVAHEDLQWAPFLNSTAAMSSPIALPGDWVIGFFIDGEEAQQPVVLGMMYGIPGEQDKETGFSDPSGTYPRRKDVGTNSPLTRGESDEFTPLPWKKENLAPDEPVTPYAAEYPNNHVMHTDLDNIIELDDTPGKERVHIFHRSGSFYEFHPDGKVVIRSVADQYEACFANRTAYVTGNLKIMVAGNATINVTENTTINSGKDIAVTAGGNIKFSAAGNFDVIAGGNIKLSSGGKTDIASGGAFAVGSGGVANIQASGAATLNGASVQLGVGSNSAGSPSSPATPEAVEKKEIEPWKKPT